jgi:tetratricopeptide (TPR) repeat protein
LKGVSRSRFGIAELLLVGLAFSGTACSTLPQIAILHDPLTSKEHLTLGQSYEAEGAWDRALSEYREALGRSPRKEKVYFMIGNVYYLKGDYREADRAYRSALRHDPDFAAVYNNRAWNYLKRGMRDDAVTSARRSVALSPDITEYQDTLKQMEEKTP